MESTLVKMVFYSVACGSVLVRPYELANALLQHLFWALMWRMGGAMRTDSPWLLMRDSSAIKY